MNSTLTFIDLVKLLNEEYQKISHRENIGEIMKLQEIANRNNWDREDPRIGELCKEMKRLTINQVSEILHKQELEYDAIQRLIKEGLEKIVQEKTVNGRPKTIIDCNGYGLHLGALAVLGHLARLSPRNSKSAKEYCEEAKLAAFATGIVSMLPTCIYDEVVEYWDVDFDDLK
jgi:hypothetical protein